MERLYFFITILFIIISGGEGGGQWNGSIFFMTILFIIISGGEGGGQWSNTTGYPPPGQGAPQTHTQPQGAPHAQGQGGPHAQGQGGPHAQGQGGPPQGQPGYGAQQVCSLSLSVFVCVFVCVCVCVCNESSLLHTLVFDAHRVMDLSECCLCAHAHKHKHTHRAMDLRVSTPPPRAPLGKGRVESGGSGMLSRLS